MSRIQVRVNIMLDDDYVSACVVTTKFMFATFVVTGVGERTRMNPHITCIVNDT